MGARALCCHLECQDTHAPIRYLPVADEGYDGPSCSYVSCHLRGSRSLLTRAQCRWSVCVSCLSVRGTSTLELDSVSFENLKLIELGGCHLDDGVVVVGGVLDYELVRGLLAVHDAGVELLVLSGKSEQHLLSRGHFYFLIGYYKLLSKFQKVHSSRRIEN